VNMLRRLLFVPALWLAVTALAGCGGEAAAKIEAPDVLPSPDVDTGGVLSTEEVNFTVDVIGEVSLGMPPGEVAYTIVAEQQIGNVTLPEHYELAFWQDDGDTRYSVVILFPLELEPGTYDIITGAMDPVDQGVAAQVWHGKISGPLDRRERVDYNKRVEGTFTLDRAGEIIAGSFAFAAEALAPDAEGATPPTVNVAGTFTDIELTGGQTTPEATEAAPD